MMHATKITVTVGRTCPHPTESFANFRLGLTIEATLSESEFFASAFYGLETSAWKLLDEAIIARCKVFEEEEVRQQRQRGEDVSDGIPF